MFHGEPTTAPGTVHHQHNPHYHHHHHQEDEEDMTGATLVNGRLATSMEDPKDADKQLAELKEWVSAQPHVPKEMDDKLLRRFLHSCYYDLDKAEKAIEGFTSLRATSPELFVNRDPMSPQIQKIMKIFNLAQIRLSGNRNLWVWQLNDPGLAQYDPLDDARFFFLSTDAWLLEEEQLEESDILIVDLKDITLKIFIKLNLSLAKKLFKYQQEDLPIRLKTIHMVNAPPFIDKLFAVIKPFMHKNMADMINYHLPNSETLFQFLSRDELPKDFGGNLDTMENYNKKLVEALVRQRETLTNADLWRAPEKKSKNKSKNASKNEFVSEVSEVNSFRDLTID